MSCLFSFFITVFLQLAHQSYGQVSDPIFPNQAQFLMERIILDGQHARTLTDIIYDYDGNRLIVETDQTIEFHNFTSLKKAIYAKAPFQQCQIYPIDVDNPLDPYAAMTDPIDASTHIRPLIEFLFLSNNASYMGSTTLRGFIPVDQWKFSPSNDTEIISSIANADYSTPAGSSNYSIPVQGFIKRVDTDDVLLVWNLFKYRIGIAGRDLTPPRGVFCPDLVDSNDLISLQDVGMVFPERFSVRVDATTTARELWTSGHLRYVASNDNKKLIRYDFTPGDNTENPQTILLDYSGQAPRAYQIDRRTGFCLVNQSMEIISANNILHNPIEVLLKHEIFFISSPLHHIFQYVGERPCRGSIVCSIYIAKVLSFPPDSENNWMYSTIEWAWSKHEMENPNSPYDYPVYLHLNLYRGVNEIPATVHYEFYDYRQDVYLNEFDLSACYRSNQLWYQHLAFQLRLTSGGSINDLEEYLINRRDLAQSIRTQLTNVMTVKPLRVSQVELDHAERDFNRNDTLYCIFTLLDRTPFLEGSQEIELLDAQRKFETVLDAGQFQVETNDGLQLQGIPKSLENIQYFYSFNENRTGNASIQFMNITVYRNRTIDLVIEQIQEKVEYSDGAQAGAVVGGMLVGILFGTIMVFLGVFFLRRQASRSPTGGLTFRNISFRIGANRKQEDQATIIMDNPVHN